MKNVTLAEGIQISPSLCLSPSRLLSPSLAHAAPRYSGIWGCASTNPEDSRRPACAVTHL